MLTKLSTPEGLDADVAEILQHLVQGGPEAMRKIKDLIRAVSRGGPVTDAVIDDTAARIAEIRVSPEGREGIASFLEKRKPSWLPPKKG